MLCPVDFLDALLARAGGLWLFLDYDGTLADFAPTPDDVLPDAEVIALLNRLQALPQIRVAVISGRRLAHIERLAPVEGVLLAGTYGVELRLPDGSYVQRVPQDAIRPMLEVLKARWAALLAGRRGFYLEDKGWALAIHGRFAEDAEAAQVIAEGRRVVQACVDAACFRILGGHKFLEVGPRAAHKGETLAYLLEAYPWQDAQLLYIGDDDKDEEAFDVIRARGGSAIVVAAVPRETAADCRLASPRAVRDWLAALCAGIGPGVG